ncbi:unnamed protein product [Cutaneotrichosporon oleaginosum]
MPGNPSSHQDYLKKEFDHLNYGTCVSFFLWMASRMPSSIGNPGPSISTLKGYWYHFKAYYFAKRGGQSIPHGISRAISTLFHSLLEDNILCDIRKARHFTSPEGLRCLAFVAWEPEWSPNVLRRRWHFTFWQAAMLQGTLWANNLFDDSKERVVTYDHFRLVISRVSNDDSPVECQVGLLYRPVAAETAQAEDKYHVLNSTTERWLCPVTSFLVLACLNQALPENFDFAMLDDLPSLLNGVNIKILSFNKADTPVFGGENAKAGMYGNPWNLKGLAVVLKRLCELAEFESYIVPSSYRVMGLQLMSISGLDRMKLQTKATHVHNSTISKYGKFVCKCGHKSYCISAIIQHQLSHGLWVADLPKAMTNSSFQLPCDPRYFWEIGCWVADPLEIEQVCERLYRERFVDLPPDYRYRIRFDIQLGAIEAAALEPDLLSGYTDHSDSRRLCPSTILCEQVCFCCLHSTAESFSVRMRPPKKKHHQSLHICCEFLRARDEQGGIFIRKRRLICPDLVCSRHDRSFDNLLHLAWHLAAVHRVQLRRSYRSYRDAPMSHITVASASPLIIFLAACDDAALDTTLRNAANTPMSELDWTRALNEVDFVFSAKKCRLFQPACQHQLQSSGVVMLPTPNFNLGHALEDVGASFF